MSEHEINLKGLIPLYDNHAIGIRPVGGNIGLHPMGAETLIAGIRVNVDILHFREYDTGGFMILENIELAVPAEVGNYVGKSEGWQYWKTNGNTDIYKPNKLQFLPDHTEFTTFALLDAFDEPDPYFYFGWSMRMEQKPIPNNTRQGTTVAYMGVNYPIEDLFRPGWEEVPSEDELYGMLKPKAPEGAWNLKARISGFTVDPEPPQFTYITIRVQQGRSCVYTGAADFIEAADHVVGEKNLTWDGYQWGTAATPGTLTFLTGMAAGHDFPVIGTFYTGSNPPPDYPQDTICFITSPSMPSPGEFGAVEGDEYRLVGPFLHNAHTLFEFHKDYGPGTYPPLEFNQPFVPIL